MEMKQADLVLRDKRWLDLFPHHFIHGLALLLVALLPVAIAIILAQAKNSPDTTWAEFMSRLIEVVGAFEWSRMERPLLGGLMMIGFIAWQTAYMRWAQRTERLILSQEGISYISPLPSMLKQFQPDWSIAWNDLKTLQLVSRSGAATHAELIPLILHTPTGKRGLYPMRWVSAEKTTSPASRFGMNFRLTQPSQTHMRESIMASELVRNMLARAPHLSIDFAPLDSAHTSLEKNPHGRIAIAIIIALMIYTFVDTLVGPDSYIDEPLSIAHIYILSGIAGAILSGAWLYKSALAVAEKAGLAILLGAVVAGAMIPGALRLNALTDSTGGIVREYFVTRNSDGVVLRPLADGLPDIDYFAGNAFWNKFGEHDTYPVILRKGALGFYQFDSAAIVDDIHRSAKE